MANKLNYSCQIYYIQFFINPKGVPIFSIQILSKRIVINLLVIVLFEMQQIKGFGLCDSPSV